MMTSMQGLSTGSVTVAATSLQPSSIKNTDNNFVVKKIIASCSANTNIGEIKFMFNLQSSRDQYMNKFCALAPYLNNDYATGFYPSTAAQTPNGYARENGKSLFMIPGGETIEVNFQNLSGGTGYVSLTFFGFYVDAAGRRINDVNLPMAVIDKLIRG